MGRQVPDSDILCQIEDEMVSSEGEGEERCHSLPLSWIITKRGDDD